MKSILILGGNPETRELVQVANGMGLCTIVIDPYTASPAKLSAVKSYEVDVTDASAVDRIIADESPCGVLVGVADVLVFYYWEICRRNKLPCYASQKSAKILTNKNLFAIACKENGISTTPQLGHVLAEKDIRELPFPIVVKPVDAGAGVGMSVVRDAEGYLEAVSRCLESSLSREYIVERYMDCEDCLAYFTILDGRVHLSAMADRYKINNYVDGSAVCIGAQYPSKHIDEFERHIVPKISRLTQELGVENGVLLIQFFVEEGEFYAYDPGFRLQGEAPHIYLRHFNGFDHREMLLNFALGGKMFEGTFESQNDPRFAGNLACTIWVLLNEGVIAKITGLEVLNRCQNIISVLTRFDVGDYVTKFMIGTERQVFARFHVVGEDHKALERATELIHNELQVVGEHGEDMIADKHKYQPGNLRC